ncbi:kinase-like protein, partial [Thelephora ganbajun]
MAPPTHPTLRRLHGLDTSSPDFRDQLDKALHGQEYRRCVSNIEGDGLKWLVNYLDEVLGRLDLSSPVSRKCLRELRNICSTSTILPTSYTLSTDHLGVDLGSFATGGYADMYRGTLNDSGICIKRIRIHSSDDERATKVFCQEAVIWKYLKHPNILSLLGVTTSPLQLISGWMSGGNLQEYIKNNSNADRLELLCEVANGLCYLHSCNVIHGSIRGPNILVDDSGHIRIADFGDATIVKDQDSVEDDLNGLPPSTRWDAPEVIDGGPHSKESDVFSFAMVMIEVRHGWSTAQSFGSLAFRINTDIHWCDSVQRS